MRFFDRATSVAVIVFRSVWSLFAIGFWVVGLVGFANAAGVDTWFMWGAMCAVPLCIHILRQAIASAREGARRGSREYTVTYDEYSNTARVTDNSGSGCLLGFLGGVLGGLLIGPLLLPVYTVLAIITVVRDIRAFISSI